MPREWFECTVEVPSEYSEVVASFLMDQGAPGLQSDDRCSVTTLTAYFLGQPPLAALHQLCADIGFPLSDPSGVRVRRVPEENWAENWKAHFRQHTVGQRLCICPPWDAVAPQDYVAVVINPGMAFGTGGHATTRGCLVLIERELGRRQVTCALDVGTGSGILAVALVKLGVPEVWAIDTDPSACAVAADNARRNGIEGQLHIAGSLEDVPDRFDVVVANLFANLLEEMAAELVAHLAPTGTLVCSGFLLDDERRVQNAYEACGLRPSARVEDESWVTLAMQRPERR